MSGEHRQREQNLLGAAMTFRTVLDTVSVDSADFADPRHAALWDLMVDMRGKGRTVDPSSVLGALTRIPVEDRIGIDGNYLHDLVVASPVTATEGTRAAEDVTNNAGVRRLHSAGLRIAQVASAGGDALELQEMARGEVDAAARQRADVLAPVSAGIDETIDELENPTAGMETPWPDLNHFIRGWKPGRLYAIGARPAVGKSIIALQAAVEATKHGIVSFHSLEMSKEDIDHRLFSQIGQVPLGRLAGRTDDPDTHLTQRDWTNIANARAVIADMPLYADYRSEVTVADIRARARALQRKGPLSAVFVDYMQLVAAPRHMRSRPRQEIVAEISRSLKVMAKELNVPVIFAVQLNRGLEARADKRPTMADIRESGQIEQDCDVILLLHAEGPMATDLDLIVEKNRQGTPGVVELERQGHYARAVPRPWRPKAVTPPAHQYAN